MKRRGTSRLGFGPAPLTNNVSQKIMAYLRYDGKCDWYVFWQESDATRKEDMLLAIWHIDHRTEGPVFTYAQIQKMLEDNDFSIIPGFIKETDDSILRPALQEFVADVDKQYK